MAGSIDTSGPAIHVLYEPIWTGLIQLKAEGVEINVVTEIKSGNIKIDKPKVAFKIGQFKQKFEEYNKKVSGLQNELTQAISDEVERPIPTELKEKAKGDGIYNVIVYSLNNLLDKSDINKSISEYRTEKQEHKFEQRQL